MTWPLGRRESGYMRLLGIALTFEQQCKAFRALLIRLKTDNGWLDIVSWFHEVRAYGGNRGHRE
jgi:hypothetical protein